MSKEFTPLQALEELKNGLFGHCRSSYLKDDPKELESILHTYNGFFNTIETALKDYESRKVFLDNVDNDVVIFEPKEVWEEKQKKVKALDIIKKYGTNIIAVILRYDTYEHFMESCFRQYPPYPTKEEYEFLKEVLGNE